MMDPHSKQSHVLLTGATGLIGHYLLARLLERGIRCAAVVRNPDRDRSRLAGLIEPLGVDIVEAIAGERLVLLRGDLLNGIDHPAGLQVSDIVHLAGCTRFHRDGNGDPSRTNVQGTKNLLEWASQLGIARVHLASTAYAGGRTSEVVDERPLPRPDAFNNDYEQSKWMCEQQALSWAHEHSSRCVTIVRPSIVVGDWESGRTTSFSGLYLATRAVQAAANLLRRPRSSHTRRLDVRIPGTAAGVQNIVPVDYVADMIAAIVLSEAHHGGFFNLVHPSPPRNDMIRLAIETALNLRGLSFGEAASPAAPRSRLERVFDRVIAPICPYLAHSPCFSRARAQAVEVAAHVQCPAYDLPALVRMCSYAVTASPSPSGESAQASLADQAADYFEHFLARQVEQSSIARAIGLTADVRFTLTGIPDGAWLCRFDGGRVTRVLRSDNGVQEDFGYRVDASTFLGIVAARLDPQEAFLSGRIELLGDIERALKMAMVLHQFNSECPYPSTPAPSMVKEIADA